MSIEKITRRDFLKVAVVTTGGCLLTSCESYFPEESSITPVAPQKSIPIILDTDIGFDIDDTWALVMLLNSPELDIKLIVTATGDTLYRAKIVAKMLEIAEMTEIPIGIGTQHDSDGMEFQADWVKNYDLSHFPGIVYQDGVEEMINTMVHSSDPLTLVSIAPMSNIAEALEMEPEITNHARVVGMHGSIRRGYHGAPQPVAEYNVVADTLACKKVDAAPWDVTITPLDTCGVVSLRGDNYQQIRHSRRPLAKALMENIEIWLDHYPTDWLGGIDPKTESTILFDTVAGYLALSESFLTMENLKISITDDGYTVIEESGKEIRCATEWKDYGAFEKLLVTRVTA